LADTLVPQSASDLTLTIYNDDRAFVHEIREANVTAGIQTLTYEGVPSRVIPASVVPTFSRIDTRLFSQNYMYDLISLDSMLKNSINQTVAFYTNGKNPTLSEGTLLSYKPSVMVRQKGSGKIFALTHPTQVVFAAVPKSMITRPSLVWNIETTKAGTLEVDLKYLTTGLSWKSDYVLNLSNGTLDLMGWITVNNRSGVSYPNARIACIAGDVNRVRERTPVRMQKGIAMSAVPAPEVAQESFAGYHLYTIPFRETIADNQQKQIRFLDKVDVRYTQYGQLTNRFFARGDHRKLRFQNTIEFINTQDNHLGLPLPGGIVRMYRNDRHGQSRFIGESRIENIPEGETVRLRIGTLFDVTGERRVTKYIERKGYKNVETTYTLHNRGETKRVLKIEETVPTYGNSIKLKTSCSGPCSLKKKNAFARIFTVELKAKESYTFTSEFEVYN
jgi:hypothetical protein